MAKSLEAWKNSVLGKKIDFDNQSYDCVDVSKSWVIYLSDKPWQESAGWGNAKDIYSFWKDTYLSRIPRGNAPQLGDIIVMNGQVGGGYGHTGVIIAVDGRNVQIAQQNTFTQQAVYTGWFDAYSSYITGFLRPKVAFTIGTVPQLQSWQRIVGPDSVFYRKAPNLGAEPMVTANVPDGKFKTGDVIDFKGFVRGESVDGNNVWFVGRYTGGYSWSGGYSDSGTHDLENLTPTAQPPLADNQRKVGTDAMNVRTSAKIDTVNNNVVRLLQPETVITVKGYVTGQNVDGIDKWFVLDDNTYTWVGGYTNQDYSKFPDLTPKPPVGQPEPQYPAPTTDAKVTGVVNKKHPNQPLDYTPTDLVTVANNQQLRSEAAASLALMRDGASRDSVALNPQSGYRSYTTQKSLYDSYVKQDGQEKADRYSARPGHSEHQTGLVIDFSPIEDSFATTATYSWLIANAYKYGWVLRYPSDKEAVTGYMYEPWHWRYVGVTAAADMRSKSKTTLEEYYNIPGGKYANQEPAPEPEPQPEPGPEPQPEPEPEPKPPSEEKEATVEAMKTVGRNGLLAAVSAAITALANWLLGLIAGLTLPQELVVSIGGLVYAGLLALDKYIHENVKIKWRGLIGF